MSRAVTDRMAEGLRLLDTRSKGKRRPKAFYLVPEDWAAFMATNPPLGRFPFGNNPTIWGDEPMFQSLPVRRSKGAATKSRLYDHTTTGRALPQ